MPARENNTINNDKAAKGWFFEIPESSFMSSIYLPLLYIKNTNAKKQIFIDE